MDDIDFDATLSETGENEDEDMSTLTVSLSPEPVEHRLEDSNPTPSLSPSPDANPSTISRPPVPIPPSGSGRLGYLLGVPPTLRKMAAGGSGSGSSSSRRPAATRAVARVRAMARSHSPLGGAGRGRGSGAATSSGTASKQSAKGKGKSPCDTSCNSQAAMRDGLSESVDEDCVVLLDKEDVVELNRAAKRRLTAKCWKEMEKKEINGEWKAICNCCHKHLSAASNSGTTHLNDHLKICTRGC
ncbi:hypothetical protein BRADI_3g24662v3 [Brachypodium distachyon]|uniref:BED-type domain-containing protein n=1 Tax=Brachypodium distachyon TaxID=15368 RepID=A0A0Q3F9Q3_BRADI|nr:hypothetical protein BRADI_3g24662v3 [Brachypodium distachyon]